MFKKGSVGAQEKISKMLILRLVRADDGSDAYADERKQESMTVRPEHPCLQPAGFDAHGHQTPALIGNINHSSFFE